MHPGLTLQLATVFAIGLAVAPQASANEYPVRPVRVLTGNAGATADIVTRQLGRRLTERWGQQIVVDNRGGAAATIAAEIAANAPPDGYTLLMGQFNFPYDLIRQIVKFRVAENLAKAQKKGKT